MKKKIKILCTLGPSSLNEKIIKILKKKVDYFRLNMSHLSIQSLKNNIKFLKKYGIKNICIDTEGAQVRTGNIKAKKLSLNQKVIFYNSLKNKKSYYLYPKFKFEKIKINTKFLVGFNDLELKVIKSSKSFLEAKVTKPGLIAPNKGVHFQQEIKLDGLTDKDIEAIKIARKHKINIFALSFANNSQSVKYFRTLIGKSSFLISKIESLSALKNLNSIIKNSNAILIDRGDLSRYVPIEAIPIIQKKIIKKSKKLKTECYVATNLLESMIQNNAPTRAESNDINITLESGASGLVLAAETAIGKYPNECVNFLKDCIRIFQKFDSNKYF